MDLFTFITWFLSIFTPQTSILHVIGCWTSFLSLTTDILEAVSFPLSAFSSREDCGGIGCSEKCVWRFEVFTSRARLAVNPFNPNTLPSQARRDFTPPFSLFFILWAICRLSQLAGGWEGCGGTLPKRIHFCSRSRNQRSRRTEPCVWRALFISSLSEEGRGGGRGRRG